MANFLTITRRDYASNDTQPDPISKRLHFTTMRSISSSPSTCHKHIPVHKPSQHARITHSSPARSISSRAVRTHAHRSPHITNLSYMMLYYTCAHRTTRCVRPTTRPVRAIPIHRKGRAGRHIESTHQHITQR